MSAKSIRRWVACVVALAVAFGQFAATAHACTVQRITGPIVVMHAEAPASGEPCANMGTAPIDVHSNICESHCSTGVSAPAQPDLPAAALIALPAAPVIEAGIRAHDAWLGAGLIAVSRAPPLTLQFCRLLI